MTDTTLTVAGKTFSVDKLEQVYADLMLGDCLANIDRFKKVVETAVAASGKTAALMADVDNGSEFRIAFKKKGESEFTRLAFVEQDLLRGLALEELTARQEVILTTLADAMGVDNYTITFGD
jgi:hypothetical protein